MTDKVQLIKEEIERRINEYKNWMDYQTDSNYLELQELLGFIDSLPEENHFEDKSEMVNEGLEEEYDKYFKAHETDIVLNPYTNCKDIARHFAEWQKQQMMKDAVEGRVQCGYGDGNKLSIKAMLPQDSDLKYADKVKVLILKTE